MLFGYQCYKIGKINTKMCYSDFVNFSQLMKIEFRKSQINLNNINT